MSIISIEINTDDACDKFQVATSDKAGFPVCAGLSPFGATWKIYTKGVSLFDLRKYKENTQADDAALICAMLNLYYGSREFAAVVDTAIEESRK